MEDTTDGISVTDKDNNDLWSIFGDQPTTVPADDNEVTVDNSANGPQQVMTVTATVKDVKSVTVTIIKEDNTKTFVRIALLHYSAAQTMTNLYCPYNELLWLFNL